MAHSIFAGTIADMPWPAIEEAGRRDAVMVVPVAVIEQHGPHLPVATDVYGAYLLSVTVMRELTDSGIECVVAPPYYFGVNAATHMFPGSLNISSESMIRVLVESLENYAAWGFRRQFLINHHGDPVHNTALVEVIRAARAKGIDVVYTMGGFQRQFIEEAYAGLHGEGLPLDADALLAADESAETRRARETLKRSDWGVHAEERETSLIMRWFPDALSSPEQIPGLEPVAPSLQEFDSAIARGKWRELSPLGYIGDPSVASEENGELYRLEGLDIARGIVQRLTGEDASSR